MVGVSRFSVSNLRIANVPWQLCPCHMSNLRIGHFACHYDFFERLSYRTMSHGDLKKQLSLSLKGCAHVTVRPKLLMGCVLNDLRY